MVGVVVALYGAREDAPVRVVLAVEVGRCHDQVVVATKGAADVAFEVAVVVATPVNSSSGSSVSGTNEVERSVTSSIKLEKVLALSSTVSIRLASCDGIVTIQTKNTPAVTTPATESAT